MVVAVVSGDIVLMVMLGHLGIVAVTRIRVGRVGLRMVMHMGMGVGMLVLVAVTVLHIAVAVRMLMMVMMGVGMLMLVGLAGSQLLPFTQGNPHQQGQTKGQQGTHNPGKTGAETAAPLVPA